MNQEITFFSQIIVFYLKRSLYYDDNSYEYQQHTSRQRSCQTTKYLHGVFISLLIKYDNSITANLRQNVRSNVSLRITNENMHRMIK